MRTHIGLVSLLFDRKPEGICTGRLARALLDRGARITLYTSAKADRGFEHEALEYLVASHRPRDPRRLFRLLARWRGDVPNNFYLWGKRVTRLLPRSGVPDCFYGRAWPHASLVAAAALARRHRKPLMLHFSDPFPPPNETWTDQGFMRDLQGLVDQAAALSFTNRETIDYQRRFLRFDPSRAFVLNHVGPPEQWLGAPTRVARFCYLGALGEHRPVEPLLRGFHRYRRNHPEARLVFVGASREYLESAAARCGGLAQIEILPFTTAVSERMRDASVLVSVDVDARPAIFTPTKLIEYLRVDRPVLALTPENSPVARLLARSPETTVAVHDSDPASIAAGLGRAAAIAHDEGRYRQRFAAMRDFDAEAVAGEFERMLDRALAS